MSRNDSPARPAAPRPAMWLLVALLLGAGCAPSLNLKVAGEVPLPTVTKIPLSVGVYYDDALKNYTYTENSEDRPNWKIESGSSQVALFNQILPSMFQGTVPISAMPAAAPGPIAAVIAPKVADMQFALPTETKSEFYEAWVKYTMRLLHPDGSVIAEWPVTGYGKAPEGMLQSRDAGLQAAIQLALRDAGAKIAIGFEHVGEVRAWLAAETKDCQRYADQCSQRN